MINPNEIDVDELMETELNQFDNLQILSQFIADRLSEMEKKIGFVSPAGQFHVNGKGDVVKWSDVIKEFTK